MNAVVAHSPAHHVHDVACHGRLHVGGSAVRKVARHDTNRSTIDERFADIAVIENDGPVHRRDAGFVPTYTDTGVNASQNSRWVEEVVGELAFPIGRAKAENVGVRDRAGPQSGSEDVTVHTDDARHGTAVRVEGGGGIVGFSLHAHAPLIVPCNDA